MKNRLNYPWLVNAVLYVAVGVCGFCEYIPAGRVMGIIGSALSLVIAAVWVLLFFKDRS